MKSRRLPVYIFSGVALVAAMLLTAAGVHHAAQQATPPGPSSLAGVPNFGRVSATLYRGGQPSDEGLLALKKSGVEIVVNFRNEPDRIEKERHEVEALGLRYVSIPWSSWHAPSNQQVAEFLELLRANPQKKTFVHCHHGSDRTGVMVAAYRIAFDNWTPAAAIEEMNAYHFHRFWMSHLKHYIEGFPQQLARNPIFRAPQPAVQATAP